MKITGTYDILTSDRSRKIGVTFDLETRDFSFDRSTMELEVVITQPLRATIVADKSKVEYEFCKLAASVLELLAQNDAYYMYPHMIVKERMDDLKPYFEKPDIVDGTARDITNIKCLT